MKLARCIARGSCFVEGVYRTAGTRWVMPMSRAIAHRHDVHIHSIYDAQEPPVASVPKAGTSAALPFEAEDRAIAKENVTVRKRLKKQ